MSNPELFHSTRPDVGDPADLQPSYWNALVDAVVLGTRTINGQPLSDDVVLTIPDPDLSGLVLTTDPRLSDARAPLAHTQAFSTITGLPTSLAGYGILDALVLPTRTVNGHALSADVTVTKADVGLSAVENTALSTWAGSANLTALGTLPTLTVTAPIVGSVTGSSGSTTGNAATATALQTTRAINGVNFNGTAAITVPAAAGTLTGTTLAAGVTGAAQTWAGLQTFSGGVAITGVLATSVNSLVTASTDGFVVQNTTPATGAIPVQISPRIRQSGTAWDTAVSKTVDFWTEVQPVNAATPTGIWKLLYSLNGGAGVNALTVNSAGGVQASTLTLFTSLTLPDSTSAFAFATRGQMGATANARWLFRNAALTSGVALDFSIDGHLQIVNRSLSFGARFNVSALPTVASGFGTSPAVTAGSTPFSGGVTVGSGGVATTGVINFNGTAFPFVPTVLVYNRTTGAICSAVPTATTLTISAPVAFGAGDVLQWIAVSL